MTDHADDCAIVTTGVCTCTRGIGQPAAQVTRKLLVEEYQRGKEEGYLRGFVEGEEAAWAKMIAQMNRPTVGYQDPDAEPYTEPISIVQLSPVEQPIMPTTGETPTPELKRPRAHRHRAEDVWLEATPTTYTRDEFDEVPEPQGKERVNWQDLLFLAGLALGILLITGSTLWFFSIPRWPLIAIGVAVAAFFIMLIKLDYDYRRRNERVHRT